MRLANAVAALGARAARLAGYVPVLPDALASWPWLAESCSARHVAAPRRDSAAGSAATRPPRFIARLGVASTRRHVLITLRRGYRTGPRTIDVDRWE